MAKIVLPEVPGESNTKTLRRFLDFLVTANYLEITSKQVFFVFSRIHIQKLGKELC